MSYEVPMSAAEEAEFYANIARIEALRDARRHRLEREADERAQAELEKVPMFLRKQAD